MKNKYNPIITGTVFIVIGVFLLLQKLQLIDLRWHEFYPFLFLGLGIVLFLKALRGNSNSAFWATFSLTLGLFFVLRNYDLIGDLWFADVWPVILIGLGLGFIVLFSFRPGDWGLVIPGFFLSVVGVLLFMDQLDLSWWYTKYVARNFWSIVLIVIGLAMIVGSLTRKSK